jgi:uncharacterized protein YgiM (DUF1202 family)
MVAQRATQTMETSTHRQEKRMTSPSPGHLQRVAVVAGFATLTLLGCTGNEPAGTSSTTSAPTSTTISAPSLPPTTEIPAPTTTSSMPTQSEPRAGSCADREISQPSDTALTFYAVCEGPQQAPYPIYRHPGGTRPTLEQSVTALLAGTTSDEQAAGLYTGFDGIDEGKSADVSALINSNGVARVTLVVDGQRWVPDTAAWSSDQLLSLLDPLYATVFATPEVTALDMSSLCFEQVACNRIVTRAEWEGMLLTNTGTVLHDDCTPELAWTYPERCTIDGILAEPTVPATVTGVAQNDVLNLRSGPGAEYFVHGELDPGATVAVTTAADVAVDGGVWSLVDAGREGVGWVNAAFLDVARTPAEEFVDAFIAFARNPGDATFSALALADDVALGLGPRLIRTVTAPDLRRTATWRLEEDFRAHVGPFSALDRLARWRVYDVTVGEHDHCASPPVPAPAGFENLDRVSVQPRLGLMDGCLMWGTVDFFVQPDGKVAAITLDMWEP